MTDWFSRDPVMQHAQNVGGMAGLLNNGADYWGEHRASEFLYSTPIYSSSAATNPNSIFGQQPTTSNNSIGLGNYAMDTFQIASGQQATQSAMATIDAILGNSASQGTNASGQAQQAQQIDPDDIADARQDEVDKIGEKHRNQRNFDNFEADLNSGDEKKINKALSKLAKLPYGEFTALQQHLENKGVDLYAMLEGLESNPDVSTSKLDKVFDKYDASEIWLEAEDAELELLASEVGDDRYDIADFRQESVDFLLDRNTTQKRFEKLDKALATTDEKEINDALKTIKGFSKKEIMAFQQYLEGQGKDLETILAAAEGVAGVTERTIDKIEDKYYDAQDWIEAFDIDED